MATRENKPVQGGISPYAAILALTIVSAAPVLAATDRVVSCDEPTIATLEVAETEFSTSRVATSEDAVDLLGADFQLRSTIAVEDDEAVKSEQAVEDDSESAPQRDTAVPADASQLSYKRQMYRRDI